MKTLEQVDAEIVTLKDKIRPWSADLTAKQSYKATQEAERGDLSHGALNLIIPRSLLRPPY